MKIPPKFSSQFFDHNENNVSSLFGNLVSRAIYPLFFVFLLEQKDVLGMMLVSLEQISAFCSTHVPCYSLKSVYRGLKNAIVIIISIKNIGTGQVFVSFFFFFFICISTYCVVYNKISICIFLENQFL